MTMAIGGTITGATEGSILFVGPGGVLAQDNANFFWHDGSDTMGIGTNSPIFGLQVIKNAPGSEVRVDAQNTSGTAGSHAKFLLAVQGINAGDPYVVFVVGAAQNWSMGVDNDDADKFKISASGAPGVLDRLTITPAGQVGIGTTTPSALLQLAAGTATAGTAPLKLTAGTNLTTPEAGAMEFDGTDLFVTLANGRRRFLTSHVANVRDFGAKGDGTTDD